MSGFIPDFDDSPENVTEWGVIPGTMQIPQKEEKQSDVVEDITDEEKKIERLKAEFSKTKDFPRFTEYLMRTATANNAYLRSKARYTGNDPEKLQEKADAVAMIEEKHKQAAIDRMKEINALIIKNDKPFCKYCLNKGYTVGVRNDFELVAHPCSCTPYPEKKR